ncbi:hypothetical protein [Sphingomonas agri]|uniref:hypothetical protein n=1 Tax=Sphingomonas agri TaxID=1813878 RepID=UPI0031204781
MIGIINSAYLGTGAIAALASLKSRSPASAAWWVALSVGLTALGILRVVEAGVWSDNLLRSGLHQIGWYDKRRPIQVICITAFALALLPAQRLLPSGKAALTVAVFAFYGLAVLAALRSSSLHWSDALLGKQVASVTLGHATQIILLLVTLTAALFDFSATSKKSAQIPGEDKALTP